MSARPERADRKTAGGFTLLELMVVIAIMAALTGLFPLALNRFVPARRVDAAARELVADIRLAQARSVGSGKPVALEPAGNGYRVLAASGSGGDAAVTRDWRASTRLELEAGDGAKGLKSLRLFPDGSSSGARLIIRDGERSRAVVVSELTGRVRVEAGST
jgi:general secretion pathway protein H